MPIERKTIEDGQGQSWECFKPPFQDPYIYEDDDILCADGFIWLKEEKTMNENLVQ